MDNNKPTLENKIATLDTQAKNAIAAGKNSIAVGGMYIDQVKKFRLENGDDPYKVNYDTLGLQAQLAIQAGKDPNAVQKTYNDETTKLTVNHMLEPKGFNKVLAPIEALGGGIIKGATDLAANFEVAASKLASWLPFGLGEKAQQVGRATKENMADLAANDLSMQQYPTTSKIGEVIGQTLPTMFIAPEAVAGKGLAGLLKYIAPQAATNAAIGAVASGEGNYAKGATVGGIAGAIGGLISYPFARLANTAEKSITPEVTNNIDEFKQFGVNPSYAHVSPDIDTKKFAEVTANLPLSGGSHADDYLSQLETGVKKKFATLAPKIDMDAMNKLDPTFSITNLDQLDDAYLKRIYTDPKISSQKFNFADQQFQAEAASLLDEFKINPLPHSAKANTSMNYLDSLLDAKDINFEGAIEAKRTIQQQLAAINNKTTTLTPSDQVMMFKVGDLVKNRLSRIADSLNIGTEYAQYNKWFQRKLDYETLQNVLNGAYNPKNYDQFDPNMLMSNVSKVLNSSKGGLKTTEAKNTALGLQKILSQFKLQRTEEFSGLKKTLNQTVGSSLLGIAGAATAAGSMFINPATTAPIVGGIAGVRFLNMLMNSPRGIKILQSIGNSPNGMNAAKALADGFTKSTNILINDNTNTQTTKDK